MIKQTVFQEGLPAHSVHSVYPVSTTAIKCLLLGVLLVFFTGCIKGSHYGAGTLVGIRVGTGEGVGFTLGYQKYELGVCGPTGQVTVDLTEKMSPGGVERIQTLVLGPSSSIQRDSIRKAINSPEVTILNERPEDMEDMLE